MRPDEVFVSDLEVAQMYAQKALEASLSDPDVKRGIWYRWRLRRAQKTLKRLYTKEVNSRKEK